MAVKRDDNGRLVKGTDKIASRSPGNVNRVKQLRLLLTDFAVEEFPEFYKTMKTLQKTSPKEYIRCYSNILSFVTPKISSVSFDSENSEENPAMTLLKDIADYKKDKRE